MTAPAGTGTVKDRLLLQSVQLRRVKALVVPLHKELLDLLHRGQAGHGAHTGHGDGGGVAGKSQGLALGQTGGEAGAEAILPLKGFYDNLENILTNRLDMSGMEKYLAVIAANSSKGIYLEDGTLVGHLLPAIDSQLGQAQKLNRRLSL